MDKADIILYSYGEKEGNPPQPRYVFQVSNLRDPIGQKALTGHHASGVAKEVQKWISEDPRVGVLLDEVLSLAYCHVKGGDETYLTIGFRDQKGIWIAPAVAELSKVALMTGGFKVATVHRGI